ncbi:hypothetical protein BKA61DRAFT_581931 [Leptodontidium sp. MPI-SDFR-AT-0119]|nr:hypothetical protein BKA61DRAFT_581931 [Leptodontidium sp. MPI-SDFR-AT-0119]
MYSHRIVQLLAALFLLLQLGSGAAISRREPTTPSNPSTGTKRPGTSSGGENPEDNKKLTAGGGGTFEWKAKGMVVSLTFAPDIGFGLGTIPGDALTESRAPVLFKVLGKERMHAEDRSYEEIEKEAKFPATTTQYPQGTINEQTGNKKWS